MGEDRFKQRIGAGGKLRVPCSDISKGVTSSAWAWGREGLSGAVLGVG